MIGGPCLCPLHRLAAPDGTKFDPAWTVKDRFSFTWGKVARLAGSQDQGCVCCHKQKPYSQKLKHGTVYYSSFFISTVLKLY